MIESTPTFAIVGAVNHGKSSVVATLSENDEIRISSMPGETVECQKFWLRDLFVFYDTPGFQNAFPALDELKPAADASDPLGFFREFVARHRGDKMLEAECVLFEPIINGAGIVYVVDGSEPVLDIHAAEMEILRMTGQPRLAIINRTGQDDHVAAWKRRLGLHFNAVRDFNAHHAGFADRLELLETLAGIEQSWKPKLMSAVAIYREEWVQRAAECAEILVELLADALTHRESQPAPPGATARREAIATELREKYQRVISGRERKAHEAIIKLYRHRLVKAETVAADNLFDTGLFSEETWRALGLDPAQLVLAATIAGATGGAAIDFMVGGHSFLLGTIIGAGTGAAGAAIVGKQRPEIKVRIPWESPWLPDKLHVGGSQVTVGPYPAVNFPWILIDRALATFCYAVNRAHARRDEATIETTKLKSSLETAGLSTSRWPEDDRKAAERIFARMRKKKETAEDMAKLRGLLDAHLQKASTTRFALGEL